MKTTSARREATPDPAEALLATTRQFPEQAEPWLKLGNLLATRGNWEGARLCYASCCKLRPGDATAQHNWGVALQELGRLQDAIGAFERAIGLHPNYAAAYFGLGLCYQRMEAFDAALLAFDCGAGCDAKDPRFAVERARTLIKMGRLQPALAMLEPLLSAHPGHAEALNLSGIALKNLHRADEALAAYSRAIAARPEFVEALNNRGNLRLLARQFSLALEDFDRALAIQPDFDGLAATRLYAAMHVYDWSGFDDHLGQLIEHVARQRRGIQPLALQCLFDAPALQQQAARQWMAHACPLRAGRIPAHRPEPGGRIRVAYVSRDFKSHPVSFLMAEVFELHDRSQFEIIAINYGMVSEDPMQQRLRAAFDGFLDVAHLPDRQIAEMARSLRIDIAVDLSGLTEGARPAIFAWRAAPVQVMYLGYLGTSGSSSYDYLIADPQIIPAHTRACYDEKLIYLPSYQANDRHRPRPSAGLTRSALGLPESGFVYCCFNNPCKITPAVFELWMAILLHVPDAVLWVLDEDAQAAGKLRQHAEARGVAPQRIVFARRSTREVYLASLALADLFLDTLPYNAGATASDALWMGLPVLTRPGESFAGRVASSLLQAVGLPELIVQTADDYVRMAVLLAEQPARLAAIREALQQSAQQAPLWDTPAFTRSLERGYREAHRAQLAGELPTDICVA